MVGSFESLVSKKALQLNLDLGVYGTFAEIGAGQEVARRFFQVGGAAGTVAKTMSAYDMTFSDAIYGSASRYVSRDRLQRMLEHEMDLLLERLDAKCGADKRFFVFADTVAARSFRRHDESHGWLGIRFQPAPRAPLSQIIIHVRMLDPENVQQQDALGAIGVNLIHGAFHLRHRPEALIGSLLDDLSSARIEVDMAQFSGPEFIQVDNRIMSLQLVTQGLTQAAVFRSRGDAVQPADVFYKKPLLVERGSFRPLTVLTNDLLERAREMFLKEEGLHGEEPEVLMEITMQNLLRTGSLDLRDFLDRVDMLGALGRTVLISNYGEYYRLVDYLTRYTDRMVGLPLGLPAMHEIFDEKYYLHLEGGILEGLGRLFKQGVKLFVYPGLQPDGSVLTADQFQIAPHLRHLFAHLLENRFLLPMKNYQPEFLGITSSNVLAAIRRGDPSWKSMVPDEVARIISERHLFGLR